jgi:chloramphenicol 3-O-phosphotransferase
LPGTIIIVNGTSGAGKSTTSDLFVKRRQDFWLLFGIDHFLSSSFPARYSHHGPQSRQGIYSHPVDEEQPDGTLRWSFGDQGWQAIRTFHEWIAAASRQDCNIIVDHLLLTDPPVLADCAWRLRDLPTLLVTLKVPRDVLTERLENRTMDKRLPAAEIYGDDGVRRAVEKLNRLRPWFYDSIYASDCCDLEVDTVGCDPEGVCDQIEKRLAAGPGTALEDLRRRSPRPEPLRGERLFTIFSEASETHVTAVTLGEGRSPWF